MNTIRPGDVAVIAVNGLFGERMCEVAARVGAEVVRVDHEYGTPVDAQRVADAHPNPAVIAAVHAETSTGVVSDIAALGAIKGDALLITDAVTSIGGMPVLADEWGIDIGYAGSQKCIGVAPGLAPFTISERAFERRVERPQSWYLDLGLLGGYTTGSTGGGRTYHHTAPVAMVASLEAGINRILEEGLDAVTRRHQEAGTALQDGIQEMGLELFAAQGHRLPQLTSVKVPQTVDSARVRKYLLERFNIEIGAGWASTPTRCGASADGPEREPGLGGAAAGGPARSHRQGLATSPLLAAPVRTPSRVRTGRLFCGRGLFGGELSDHRSSMGSSKGCPGMEKVPDPWDPGPCELLQLDLNQQPFD